jgi:hypothetical protein
MNYTPVNMLLQFDEVGRYETPSRFNYTALIQDVQGLQLALEREFNLPFPIDDQVQDASFYCDILLPRHLVKEFKENYLYSIRISNFGRLSAIGCEEALAADVLKTVIGTIETNGFHFIPAAILDTAYDGAFEQFKSVSGPDSTPRWWDRYFDYI